MNLKDSPLGEILRLSIPIGSLHRFNLKVPTVVVEGIPCPNCASFGVKTSKGFRMLGYYRMVDLRKWWERLLRRPVKLSGEGMLYICPTCKEIIIVRMVKEDKQ